MSKVSTKMRIEQLKEWLQFMKIKNGSKEYSPRKSRS